MRLFVDPTMRNFLETHRHLIDSHDYDKLYEEYRNSAGSAYAFQLTRVLLAADIDPLKYFDNYVPEDYAYNQNIKDAMITQKFVGDNAFARSQISNVLFSENVEQIGDFAFYACENIEQVNIPKSVNRLGEACFKDSSIKSISINNPKLHLDVNCLDGCDNLKMIIFDGTVEDMKEMLSRKSQGDLGKKLQSGQVMIVFK